MLAGEAGVYYLQLGGHMPRATGFITVFRQKKDHLCGKNVPCCCSVLATLALGMLAASLALAQTRDTGAIFGNVADTQAAVIPGASVRLTSTSTGQVRSTKTNESGDYLFSLLPVGTYSVTIEHAGFRRYERKGLLLQANENVKVDVALEVGDVQSSVTVDALASQVETRLTTVKET